MRTAEALLWKVNRLRCMAPAEVVHRAREAVRLRAAQAGWVRREAAGAPDLAKRSHPWVHADARVDPAPYIAAAERHCEDRVDLFALADVSVGTPPRWNRDPTTGIEAPLDYGLLMDYRDAARVGDCKFVWELNRHLHLVTLAQAYALTGEERYARTIARHVASWIEACPPHKGINWSSANEAALRLMNWSVAWQLLGGVEARIFDGEPGRRLRERWLGSVFEQATFIRQHFSRFSSANNHLIGEAAGLFIAATTWPHWPQARAWRDEAQAIVEAEALLQNGADGVNLEQSVSYQQYEIDLLLFFWLAARANGIAPADGLVGRLAPMMEYLASVMDAGGNAPMIGDSDDGCVVKLVPEGPHETCRYRSVLATGAILLRRPELKRKAGALDDKTRWLVGAEADARYDALPASEPGHLPRRAFPDGGYYILGCDFDGPGEIKLVADAGALGYRSIAAHGHADALAFTLSVGGREFLIDPGTYAYHTKPEWRAYFRGTSAHNTVRIDGRDQSQPGGNFMWLRKAEAKCLAFSSDADRDIFEGRHDGYEALADPVRHTRRIVLDKAARRIVVEDHLAMRGEHGVELHFHASEHCAVEARGRTFAVTQGDRAIAITLPADGGARMIVERGALDPPLGWISRRFDHRDPSPTIVWRARLRGDHVLRTQIDCRGGLPWP